MSNNTNIRTLYTDSFPLGPAIAEGSMNQEKLSLLFDRDTKLVSEMNHEKSLIIGRKGSGKTTLLMSVKLQNPKAVTIYLPSIDIFSKIVHEVNEVSTGVIFVEQTSRLWDFVLWGIVFTNIMRECRQEELLNFCDELNIKSEDDPYISITNMLESIRHFPPEDWPIPEKIVYKKLGKISFLQAKRIAIDYLNSRKLRIYLLMDSLEDYKLHLASCGTALAGLLRCIGEFNDNPGNPVVLRCCLPAEKYFDYNSLSTNPLKDFRKGMLLHWAAGELIHLSAVRYSKYLQEYHSDYYFAKINKLDFSKRNDLEKFWEYIFPNTVESRIGFKEKPIAYILRHTQLLPRHFIVYLNKIISKSIELDNAPYNIKSDHVRSGVFEIEPTIRDQIIEAYSSTTQDPMTACMRTLKELKSVFTWSDFDEIAAKVTKMGILGANDRSELMSMLTEIGAVGRVVGESNSYYEGVFEYMVPHKLVFSDRDRFCIHPVFTEVFNVDVSYPNVKAIYTYWSGITDSDLEHWM